MGEVWTRWEGQVVNGIYPLRRFLNASDHSAVFLTESATEGFFNAAIKLIPAEPGSADVQLWRWKTAATFTHPYLMRLLDSGQCEIEGRRLLFVVMEYAEENLSQVLPYRALHGDEVRELLIPTLDALAFLHREGWIQGRVKPSNFLVVNDQLKLALDTVRPVGVAREKVTQPTPYDPPEAEQGDTSVASDIWGLGVTLVEALTQYPPKWPRGRSEPPELSANLPATFADTIQRCLRLNPAERPTVAELQLLAQPASASQQPATAAAGTEGTAARDASAAVPEPSTPRESPPARELAAAPSLPEPERRSVLKPSVAALIVVFVAVWVGLKVFHGHPKTAAPPVAQTGPNENRGTASPEAPPAEAPPPATDQQANANPGAVPDKPAGQTSRSANNSTAVVHEEIPRVSLSSRETIRGHVRVAVRVTVDRSGKVVRDRLESASSSNYFNRVASEAARKWRFAAADSEGPREWLLHFEFGREGTTVRATRARS